MKKMMLFVCAVVGITLLLAGCGKNTEDEDSIQPARTLQDYRQEAEQEITAENAADELDRLEAAIRAEVEAEE